MTNETNQSQPFFSAPSVAPMPPGQTLFPSKPVNLINGVKLSTDDVQLELQSNKIQLYELLFNLEKLILHTTIGLYSGRTQAAKNLGLNRTTYIEKLKKFDLFSIPKLP